ncbi:Flp pilus assembly protein TadG [Granulicella pectinivorans]|uniref:Flp pilus assembly protein TadG n=1 Tax=Granulicella pectinivorans TaxID=474950 RepID=A0A1I6MRM5_9BACT|nr:TadE/TadG family type IV pilus assembly protein [Granulicella pectinivorans]SFS18281.1 Flp pilus assembly protein TadG [Granulicella pectinivorans]
MRILSGIVRIQSGRETPARGAALLRGESGSSLIEFAFSLTILLLCIIGILDCSRLLYLNHYVGNAARDGVRYAMVRGSTWSGTSCASTSTFKCAATSANVTSYVIASSPSVMPTGSVQVTTTWPGTSASGGSCDTSSGANSPRCSVQVTVSYPFKFLIPFIPSTSLTVKSSSILTIAQ